MKWDQARQLLRLGRARREAGGGVAASPERRAEAPRRDHGEPGARAAAGTTLGRSDGASKTSTKPGAAKHPATGRNQVGKDASDSARSTAARRSASSVCVVSGKGGTGKSLVSASLARLLAARGRTLVVDADLGVANAHILQDVHPERSFADVIEGTADLDEIVTACGRGLDLLAGGSGYARLAGLTTFELQMIGRGLEELEADYRYVLIDSAAGLSNQTVAFAAACDVVLLVTTPDVTAMTDAYAFLKVFVRRRPMAMPLLVVNRSTSGEEAEHVAYRIQEVTRKFLGREVKWIGSLPEDRAAFRCTQRRMPVVEGEPESELGVALGDLSKEILVEVSRTPPQGVGKSLISHLEADDRARTPARRR